jgi:16S rRNA (cytidine1402-2'-O)-methyltransferase
MSPAADPARPEVAPGSLYVVATPIGNLGDLSPRALKVLDAVDRIAAEDTRTTGTLLQQFGVRGKLVALHEHNEDALAQSLVTDLQRGASLALVTDAGTPLVSDPGFALVRAARAAGLPVLAVPGPSALLAALSISGLPTDRFTFAGFLPAKADARRRALEALAAVPHTLVLFEASHRIEESLADLAEVLGGTRRVCVARELTKLFEESVTLPAAEALAWLRADANRSRGEFVLVIDGAPDAAPESASARRVLATLLEELPPSKAARLAAAITGVARKELYALAVSLAGHDDAPR